MLDSLFDRLLARAFAVLKRVRRVERRELTELRRWLENTNNLVHVSILLFVPFLIALVTAVSNAVAQLSFLLFPPLASGTYTLFSDPEGRYASPIKFVAGLTAGALCGWAALSASVVVYDSMRGGLFGVHPGSAALSIFLTGAFTWALGIEEPSAYSTALLVLVVNRAIASPMDYVLGVFVSTTIVATAFTLWKRRFYERRAQYLYQTVHSDDHVLVPMRGDTAETTALFGARLAAAHDAGKVVLLDVVSESSATQTDESADATDVSTRPPAADRGEGADAAVDAPLDVTPAASEAVERLERTAQRIRTRVGVSCEVVVASGDPLPTTHETARDANCDLIVTPYEEDRGTLSEFVRGVFAGPHDAVAFRTASGRERWKRILVPISRPGDTAHAMIDFATRLAGRSGTVSVCTCIDSEVERRGAESRLANLVETASGPIETRVARSDISAFLAANADAYDLLVIGSSRRRSAASRFISPPTFERIRDVDTDVAIFDRGGP